MRKYIGITCTVFCLLLCVQAKAIAPCTLVSGNLVANCEFQTGSFSSWTLSGSDVPTELGILYGVEGTDPLDGISPVTGAYQAYFADLVADPTTLSQSITTIAGDSYTVSFYLAQDTAIVSPYSNAFSASFAGDTLFSAASMPAQSYTEYSYIIGATSSSSLLSLEFGNDLGEYLVDDITVVQNASATPTATPEPPAWTLVLLGTIGFAFLRKRGTIAASPTQI